MRNKYYDYLVKNNLKINFNKAIGKFVVLKNEDKILFKSEKQLPCVNFILEHLEKKIDL